MASRKDPSGWQMVEYIVYDAGDADFWKGLKADLNPEEHDMSWESVLLKRWPNLKAVVERTSLVPQGANCPVHQVWISSNNALHPSNATKDNPLDGISRLIYGSALSVWAENARRTEGVYPHLKSNLNNQKRISVMPGGSTIFHYASLMTGPQSGKYPFISRSAAARLTDNSSYGFDLYVLSSESKDVLPRVYGSAEHVAALCWLSREALQSAKFELNVTCDQWIQVRHWLETLSLPPGKDNRLPFALRVEVHKGGTLEEFRREALQVNHQVRQLVRQNEALGKTTYGTIMPRTVDLPNRLIMDHYPRFTEQPLCGHAEMDMANLETARAIQYVSGHQSIGQPAAYHTGDLDGNIVEPESFEAWRISVGATYWIE